VQALLYSDLTNSKLSLSAGGGEFSFPELVEGEDLRLQLRFTVDSGDGGAVVSRVVHGVRAGLGVLDARPTSGTFKLKVGPSVSSGANTTGALAFDANAAAIAAALNGLSYLSGNLATVQDVEGSFLVSFASGAQLSILTVENKLQPFAALDVRAYDLGGAYVHACRLMRSPLAYSTASSLVLPPAPVVRRVQTGGNSGGWNRNEIQAIAFSAGFTGTYRLTFDSRETEPLQGGVDGPEQLAAALNDALKGLGKVQVIAVNGEAYIEFIGEYAALELDLITCAVDTAQPADLTLTLPLNSAALCAALDADSSLTLPLEVTVDLEDLSAPGVVVPHLAIRQDVTLIRALNRAGLESVPDNDFLIPFDATNYKSFNPDNLAQTVQSFSDTFGDGSTRVFSITHGLNVSGAYVAVREAAANGRLLENGVDYVLRFVNDNQVSITLDAAYTTPAADALVILILAGAPITAFINDLEITIDQVTDLRALLDAQAASIATLETVTAITGGRVLATAEAEAVLEAEMLPVGRVLPWRYAPLPPVKDLVELDLSSFRPLILLPAVHDVATEDFPSEMPLALPEYIGRVFENQYETPITLAGGGGHPSFVLAPGGFAACNGSAWYELSHYGEEASYYPKAFDLKLFEFPIDGDELTAGRTLQASWALQLATFLADTSAQWVLEIRHGIPAQQSGVTGIAVNLSAVTWNATPLLSKRITVNETPKTATFGVTVSRAIIASVDTLTTSVQMYGKATGVTGPASCPFVLGAFLCRFDTENARAGRGFVGAVFPAPSAAVGAAAGNGKITVK